MPHDPETFKNLYPFPDKGIIRQTIQDKILFGELKLPSDRMLDSKSWIEEKVEEEFKKEKKLWKSSQDEADQAWRKHQETEHGFSHLPESLKQKLHNQIWEDGHSGGYGDMENKYCDWVPVILEAYKFGHDVGVRK